MDYARLCRLPRALGRRPGYAQIRLDSLEELLTRGMFVGQKTSLKNHHQFLHATWNGEKHVQHEAIFSARRPSSPPDLIVKTSQFHIENSGVDNQHTSSRICLFGKHIATPYRPNRSGRDHSSKP